MTDIQEETRAALDAALVRLGLDLDESKKNLLLKHLQLLEQKNKELNLTRITSLDEAVVLHIEDSLSVLGEFNHADGPFCDIGTGGGFPGVPLAVVSERPGVLLDSVKKKARAVQGFLKELGIQGRVRARGMRSEELALEAPDSFDTVVARAVSSFAAVEELATPLLKLGGRLIAMRGSETDEQLLAAAHAAEKLGLHLVSSRSFAIGDGSVHRSVYVLERVREAQIKLPRRPGMAQKKPLR